MNATTNVILDRLSPQCWYAIATADRLHRNLFARPLCITSARDGQHMANSKHFTGDAFDCRTHDLTPSKRVRFASSLNAALHPLGFDVVSEPTHTHVEYDPDPYAEPWVTHVT